MHRIYMQPDGRLFSLEYPLEPVANGHVHVRTVPHSPDDAEMMILRLERQGLRIMREAMLDRQGAMEMLEALDSEIERLRLCLANK